MLKTSISKVGIKVIKISETRNEQRQLLQHSSVENPYFGNEHKIIAIPCQRGISHQAML